MLILLRPILRIVCFSLQFYVYKKLETCDSLKYFMGFLCIQDILMALAYLTGNLKVQFLTYWILQVVLLHWLAWIASSLCKSSYDDTTYGLNIPFIGISIFSVIMFPFYNKTVGELQFYQTYCYLLCFITLLIGFVLTATSSNLKLVLYMMLSILSLAACNVLWARIGYHPITWDTAHLISLVTLALAVVGLNSDSHTWQARTL